MPVMFNLPDPPLMDVQAGSDALSLLVPGADLANHSQQPSCLFWLSEEEAAFQLVALEVRCFDRNVRCFRTEWRPFKFASWPASFACARQLTEWIALIHVSPRPAPGPSFGRRGHHPLRGQLHQRPAAAPVRLHAAGQHLGPAAAAGRRG